VNCRHCHAVLEHVCLDLGFAPPSNAYLSAADLSAQEPYYPLKLLVCAHCWLVQTADYVASHKLFEANYAYFSSVSPSWLAHAKRFVTVISDRLHLDAMSFVIEVASNDGYLLKNFVAAGIPCLGIEPTESTAAAAEALGIPVRRQFFGEGVAEQLAANGQKADLIIGNNVLAHVPDINYFAYGLRKALKEGGTISLEFPHLLRMIEQVQFDTAYHEHFSYLSLHTVSEVFRAAGLRVCDVEQLSTHGGSLRVFGCHAKDPRTESSEVANVREQEARGGLSRLETYVDFQKRADRMKDDLLLFLLEQKRSSKRLCAYGAAAKGNTLLNYAGVKPDLIPYVCDAAVSKQGKFMPGSHIPILPPAVLRERRPEIVLILPWNLRDEVMAEHQYVREWGGRFVCASSPWCLH